MATKEPKFTSIESLEGETWDQLARRAYGDPFRIYDLMLDNKSITLESKLMGGLTFWVRIDEEPEPATPLPPWKDGGEDNTPTGEVGESGIPIVIAPPVELGWASGYPLVADNKLKFAINKSASYPYQVENQAGAIIFSSPLYQFSAGFPLETPPIADGGLYRAIVGSLVSDYFTVTGTVSPLAWITEPYFARDATALKANFAINKSGNYQVKITNTGTGVVVSDQVQTLTANQLFSIAISDPGTYKIEVGILSKTITEIPVTETTTKPAWITKVGITINVTTHDASIQVAATGNAELRIVGRGSTPNTSGIGWLGVPWDSYNYIPGTTDFVDAANGYSEIFRCNGTSSGVGGLTPGGTYTMLWRLESDRGNVYRMDFTVPSATITYPSPPQVISFPVITPPGTACDRGPTIQSLTYVSKTQVKFLFDGNGVTSIAWEIVSIATNTTSASGTVVVATPNGSGGFNAVFNPGNQPLISFSELQDGAYELRIQGGNCSSPVSKISFTIATTAVPTLGEPGVYKYTTSARVFRFVNSKDAKGQLNSDGSVKIVTSAQFPPIAGSGVGNIWIMNGFYCFVPDSEKNALLGAGHTYAKPGDNHYIITWVKPAASTGYNNNYDVNNYYNTFGDPAVAITNTARFCHVIIEVTDL